MASEAEVREPTGTAPAARRILVLGGQRSGKSRHAESLARGTRLQPLYLATAEGRDEEMRARIARHRADRAKDGWLTIEEPIGIAEVLVRESRPERVLLVDCLTLWTSNLLEAGRDLACERQALVEALAEARGCVILVSNEVGLATIPMHPLTRRFVDETGWTNQTLASVCDRVDFVAAGLPLTLKPAGASAL